MQKLIIRSLIIIVIIISTFNSSFALTREEIDQAKGKYSLIKQHLEIGLGLGNMLVGSTNKTDFGLIYNGFGLNTYLGLTTYRIIGAPDAQEIKKFIEENAANAESLSDLECLLSAEYIHPYLYYEYGTDLLLVPRFGFGYILPVGKHLYFKAGLQIFTLITIGANITF